MQYALNRRIMRDYLPINVVRGFDPTTPQKLSSSAAPIDDEAIKSGMLILKGTGTVAGTAGQPGFRKSLAADATGSADVSFYIALHDQDGHDVQASGKMVGLDCADDYVIRTGYFDPAITWAVDMPLTADAGGFLTEAAANGDIIVGFVTAVGTGTNNAITYVGKTPSATNTLMLEFKTSKTGQLKTGVV